MHRIPVIRLYFPLDALDVSDCISPSSGATSAGFVIPNSCITFVQLFLDGLVFMYTYCLLGINQFDVCTVHYLTICIYQMRCTAYKVAPEDGLI